VTGQNGTLVIHGYDGAHPLDVVFDDVRFERNAMWNVENAKLSVGPGGLTPPAPEVAGSTVMDDAVDGCNARWVAFPVANGTRS
jgi:polygalacturonase